MLSGFAKLGAARLAHAGLARWFRHASGAELVVLEDEGPGRFFAVTLETAARDHSGVAHVLEHMIFRGSRSRPVADLYADLVQAGPVTDLNATTCADLTTFHGTSHSEDGLAELLEIMAEALFHPLLDPSDFAQERTVVLNEMAGHWTVPAHEALSALRARLFPGSHGWDHGGRVGDLARLSLERLRGFHALAYRPRSLRLFLAGPVDLGPRMAQLDRLLSLCPPSFGPAAPATSAASVARVMHHPALPAGAVMPALGWLFPHERAVAGHLLRHLIGGSAVRGDVPAPLPVSALAHDGPKTDLALVFPSCLAAEAERLQVLFRGDLACTAAEMNAGFEELAALAADETPAERQRRLIGAWRHGEPPLTRIDTVPQIDGLWRLWRENGGPTAFLRDLIGLADRRAMVALAGGDAPGAAMAVSAVPPAPDAVRAATPAGRYRTPPPHRLPEWTISGDLPVLSTEPVHSYYGRIVLALGLGRVARENLPEVALLARHLGGGRALMAEVVPATGANADAPGWLVLRGVGAEAPAGSLAARLADALARPLPEGAALDRLIAAAKATMPPLHMQAALRLGASVSVGGVVADRTGGLSLRSGLARDPPGTARLRRLRDTLIGTDGVALIASGAAGAHDFFESLVRKELPRARALTPDAPMHERHPVPGRLNTLGLTLQLVPSPLLTLVAHALETGWLRDEIRRRGGAYGVKCIADPRNGALTFLSAHDPHREQTFERFGRSAAWLAMALRGEMLARCIDGTAARLARPLPPGPALAEALLMRLSGESPEGRNNALVRILEAREADIAAIADQMSGAFSRAARVEFLGSG